MTMNMSANLDPTKVDKTGDTMTGNLNFSSGKGIDGGLRFKTEDFTHDISVTGAQAITGVGFKPSAVIFLANKATEALNTSWGVDDGSVSNALALFDYDATSHSSTNNNGSIKLVTLAGVTEATAYISSMDSDGFTLTWSKTGSPTGNCQVKFLALR